ncbi:MAG: hypothetical protein PHQ23_13455 [Candidatus Wallbacteria bacterium]|nr:hypothetical protein [Candidatus Wallbacteria bacterium]
MHLFHQKKGLFLPLVLILLVVLTILGIFMNKSAQHEYRYTYRSSDHQRALYVAQATSQAALSYIRENMNQPGPIRKAFVNDAATAGLLKGLASIGEYGAAVKNLVNSLNSSESGAIIDRCKFASDFTVSLSASTRVNDQGTAYGDRIKRVIITVSVDWTGASSNLRYGAGASTFEKKITHCFDAKIADVRPVGNRYVMMVANIKGQDDFNGSDNAGALGEHFWVKYNEQKESLGISINGGKSVIDLFGRYYKNKIWDKVRIDEHYDLHANQSNSMASLIPGWAAGNNFGPLSPSPGGSKVADNEPWSDMWDKPGSTVDLGELERAIPGQSKAGTDGGGPHSEGNPYHCILDRGAGANLESNPQDHGQGIDWKDVTHELSGNKFFNNSGRDEGRTHLFYENCSEPCPIYGDVWKRWQAYSHTAHPAGDTGVSSACGPC